MHLADFRSEFRPLDSMQPTFSLVSPPYRGNTVSYDGESASGLFGFLFGCVLVGLFGLLCFGVFFWCFIPHHHAVFPFLSTMTWAPRPHGVRTRGKKIWTLLFFLERSSEIGAPLYFEIC